MPFNRDRLKSRRIDMGITLQEVADIIGVEKPTVQRYESGKISKIDTVTVEKLAEAIKCSPAYLMGWEDSVSIEKTPVSMCEAGDSIKDEIVEIYEELNGEGQNQMLEHAHYLESQGKYKKRDTDGKLA